MTSTARTAYAVWLVGLAVYFLAVFHRSSLAVAGLAATERFDISAAQLATFTMLQLLVYAGMQIPVGLLVDRFGSRSVLLCGTIIITAGQVGFALADSYLLALVARVFVGMGDAMTFICVLRLVGYWFPARRIPLITQLTGTLGQLGAVGAAIPMTWALSHLGWTKAYLVAASVGVVLVVLLLLVLRDSPTTTHLRGPVLSFSAVRSSLAASWSHPGTRLGFWMHFTTQFSATALSLLWGYPFFVRGEGRSSSTAGILLTVIVLAVVCSGPALGWLVGNHPWHRSTMVLCIVAAIVAVWTVVLLWPGNAPLPVLVLLAVVVGVGGPASMIGFDLARTSNPSERFASASGIINQGGFLASLVLVVVIGIVLDWRTPGGGSSYTPSAFRWAMSTQYVLWAVGLTQVWRYRVKTRRVVDRDELEGVLATPPG
ncbi:MULTISPECIES: MFS transporter [unclassified Nocardioides]|uniref:MFS transporter n=1 Tax=unclassified Nocardioides TaxID=2615069 RepID=UPI0009F07E0C|nr:MULTISPECIES: MFS transporter [unclassified Nocardioides]GAW48267.1 major facilitator transporter [Nocardioides sp. PD653-B2]GAW52915.1 major facilitator transporter [Nocardioides sp. PD653]